ncbi:hypothetical protein JF546_07925 [Nitratireductor aquimarinus]|uniref:hypothetical protein n=1 Tax=Nitratireductor aquimarinus TaxID=889300 RepID=UPI001A8FAF1A|nr:hypothetical protein [Nitratireductor aquimarinus]MBN8242933.1 hypothetical protein [Nitratireductor aquimarinus]MBY6132034.1 hypothetical protein [Nitratireductor aquimarinus]MCA1301570.1 hypothetical protein [Nitratireductor aquimarinus]
MPATNVEKLVVSLSADIRQYQRALDRANGVTNNRFRKIEKRGDQMAKRMATLGKTAMAGFAAGLASLGVTATVAGLRDVAGSIAEISNEAARAGVTTRVFQEWEAVAVKARIPVDALVDAFKELNIRGDEFAQTAKGSAAEAFARLGLTPAEVKERLKDPSEFMLLLIERTRQLKDTAAATRIFDELFGGTGAERMVSLLGQSTDEIRATISEAHTLGNVLDDEVIARAAEVDKQFNQIVHTVGQNLRGAIVSAATALQDFINAFNGFEAQRTAKLDENLAALGRERLDIERQIGELRERQRQGHVGAGDGILGSSIGESLIGESIADHERRLEALAAEEQMILRVVSARDKAAKTPEPTATGGWSPSPYTPPPSGGGSSRDASAAAAEREAEAVRRLISDLQHEMQLVGATNLERDIANTLRQAGAAATADQQAQIVSLISALTAEEEAVRRASEATAEMRDIGQDAMKGLISDLLAGKSAAESFSNVLKRIGDRLIDMALDGLFSGGGGGGIIGMIGGLFGFADGGFVSGKRPKPIGFDKGGYTGAGGKYQPAGVVHKGEYVFSKAAVDRIGVGNLEAMHRNLKGYAEGGFVAPSVPKLKSTTANAGATYAPQYSIDARGSSNPQETERVVTQALREYDKGNYQRWLSASAEARKRNAI